MPRCGKQLGRGSCTCGFFFGLEANKNLSDFFGCHDFFAEDKGFSSVEHL